MPRRSLGGTVRRSSSTTGPASPRTRGASWRRSTAPASTIGCGSPSKPTPTRASSRSCGPSSASTPARRARSCEPSSAAGGPRRSATPARTSPNATSTSSLHTRSTSTSTRSARSSASAGGHRAGRSGCGSNPAPGPAITPGLAYSGERPTKFGIYEDRLPDALAAAARHGLHDRHDPLPRRVRLARRRWSRRVRRGACDGSPGSRGRSWPTATRSREVNVGGGLGRAGPRRTRTRSTSTRTPRRSPATSARSGWPSAASRATTSRRTPRSSSARS